VVVGFHDDMERRASSLGSDVSACVAGETGTMRSGSPRDVAKGDRALRIREAMALVNGEHVVFGPELSDDELGAAERHVEEREIDLALRHAVFELRVEIFAKPKSHARMLPAKSSEHVRKEVRADRRTAPPETMREPRFEPAIAHVELGVSTPSSRSA